MKFELPQLPYDVNALAPHVSKQTLEFHHGKHHQAYVNNLNKLIEGTKFDSMDLEMIIKSSDGGIFNNAAQVWNHTFYFEQFSPGGTGKPKGELAAAIEKEFGSFEDFKTQFDKAATTLFGSGWAWLVQNQDGKLSILQTSNAGSPLTQNVKPLMTCDVWEHAYYLDYQNKRPAYIESFWNIIDWQVIEKRF